MSALMHASNPHHNVHPVHSEVVLCLTFAFIVFIAAAVYKSVMHIQQLHYVSGLNQPLYVPDSAAGKLPLFPVLYASLGCYVPSLLVLSLRALFVRG